jgi:hypothetical protein
MTPSHLFMTGPDTQNGGEMVLGPGLYFLISASLVRVLSVQRFKIVTYCVACRSELLVRPPHEDQYRSYVPQPLSCLLLVLIVGGDDVV